MNLDDVWCGSTVYTESYEENFVDIYICQINNNSCTNPHTWLIWRLECTGMCVKHLVLFMCTLSPVCLHCY